MDYFGARAKLIQLMLAKNARLIFCSADQREDPEQTIPAPAGRLTRSRR